MNNAAAATWGPLADPVRPEETHAMMRAQSILYGGWCEMRDGDRLPVLPPDQAADVVRWHDLTCRWVL